MIYRITASAYYLAYYLIQYLIQHFIKHFVKHLVKYLAVVSFFNDLACYCCSSCCYYGSYSGLINVLLSNLIGRRCRGFRHSSRGGAYSGLGGDLVNSPWGGS